MNDKLISVITPTYNCGRFISQTIESVLSQTYKNWEMIIVDDHSSDNTREILKAYMHDNQRIKYYILEENQGAAVARTIAMSYAKGSYFAFLDSDDIWLPEKLEKQLSFMEENGYAFTCTSYELIDENGRLLGKVRKAKKKTDYNKMLLDCPVGNSTVMYSVEKMGRFKVPNIRKRNDDALWLQMLKKERYIWGMPLVLSLYRIRKNSISRNKIKLIRYHWYLYRKIEKLNLWQSSYHIIWWCLLKIFGIR